MKKKKIIVLIAVITMLLIILLCMIFIKNKQSNDENIIENDKIEISNTNNISENGSTNIVIDNNEIIEQKNEVSNEEKTPMQDYGKLRVEGSKLVAENGDIVQLRGISTHGIGWFPQYINKEAFKFMRDEWNINLIRLAVYSEGYNESQNKIIENGIDYATDLGMYVIVDWHILNDNNPNINKEKAKIFFDYIANKYKSNINIIYEICNEPNGDVTWQKDIKPYSEEMINLIHGINEDAIILCGTPQFCQKLEQAAESPITGHKNIMYTLHFYSSTHKQELRNELSNAIQKGLPIFVSEFGISEASGNGNINIDEANKWIDLLNSNNISFVYWNLSNKNESTALLKSSTSKLDNWNMEELSDAGKWFINILKNK